MKKLILSLLKSAVGKAIIQIILDAFLRSLAKKGYYMTASQADARSNFSNPNSGRAFGNILEREVFRSATIIEFVDTELENVKP